ncbi:ras-like protein family member 12 isoform X1 [Anser cygnoides]|uniref:ras-like protein family member 12 isoform X1 n=1 Tax=Anser cygnoides TaxID=8845 RepID=UPI0034D2B943
MSSMFGKPRAGAERPPQSPLAECNVAILGCRGAGKSALTVKFLTKRFISEYDPNLGRPRELRALPALGQRLPRGLQHRRQGELRGLPPLPRRPRPARAGLPAREPRAPAGQQAGHGAVQAGDQSRRDGPGQQVRVPFLRGVGVPGLRGGAARLPRGGAGGAARGGAQRAPPAPLHRRGAALPARGHPGHLGHPARAGQLHPQHPLHCQLQGDPLGGPGQAGHCQVLAGSEQEESAHAHLAERLQDILRRVPARGSSERSPSPQLCEGLGASGAGTLSRRHVHSPAWAMQLRIWAPPGAEKHRWEGEGCPQGQPAGLGICRRMRPRAGWSPSGRDGEPRKGE